MAYNTTTSLEKLTFTKYVDFGKCQDRFGRFFWSKDDSNYLVATLKVLENDDNSDFHLVRNITMGESDFNQFTQLRNQHVVAAETFGRDQNLSPIQIETMPKDMEEQLKLVDKVVDVEISETLLRYKVDRAESSYVQFQLFAKDIEEKFQQNR